MKVCKKIGQSRAAAQNLTFLNVDSDKVMLQLGAGKPLPTQDLGHRLTGNWLLTLHSRHGLSFFAVGKRNVIAIHSQDIPKPDSLGPPSSLKHQCLQHVPTELAICVLECGTLQQIAGAFGIQSWPANPLGTSRSTCCSVASPLPNSVPEIVISAVSVSTSGALRHEAMCLECTQVHRNKQPEANSLLVDDPNPELARSRLPIP